MKQDFFAEKVVVGTVLKYPAQYPLATKIVRPSMFGHSLARAAYTAIEAIEIGGRHATPDKVAGTILRSDKKANADELHSFLRDCIALADTDNVESYCEDVRDSSDKREVLALAQKIEADVRGGRSPSEVLGAAMTQISALSSAGGTRDFTTPEQNAKKVADRLAKIEAGEDMGTPTGFPALDNLLTGGGFMKNNLVVIAAGSSVGKSALMASMIGKNIESRNVPVGVITIETTSDSFLMRLLSCTQRINQDDLMKRRITPEQRRRAVAFPQKMLSVPLYIDDASFTLQEIALKARRMKAEHGIEQLWIDHLSDVSSDGRFESREREMKTIIDGLHKLCKPNQLDLTVIALAQINRDYTKRATKCPVLSDIRESGTIEQKADVVLFIDRPERYDNLVFDDGEDCIGKARIVIGKQREGSLGYATISYMQKWTRFDNLDSVHELEYLAGPMDVTASDDPYAIEQPAF